jgi:branched-chain amino acid transport system ATP-binding protein
MSHELVVKGLSVRYGRAQAQAVSQAALTARGGAVTAVVGPNGAGKSSLLLGIYGSVAATGVVELDGQDISGLSPTRRAAAGIAVVPQGRQLFPRLTVRENLQVMAETLRLPASRVDEAIDRFPRLRQRVRQLAGVLSGGEQQMLVVSRALMSGPKVLLLDEMNTGLAPVVVRELLGHMTELAASGTAVIVAEPSIAVMRDHIDRGYVLIRGRVTAVGEDGGRELERLYQSEVGVRV